MRRHDLTNKKTMTKTDTMTKTFREHGIDLYFRYYMIFQNEPFDQGRTRINAIQIMIAKKGPIDLFALMSNRTNSRSY